jgi:tetratricopeptide (TPR) repeat protein
MVRWFSRRALGWSLLLVALTASVAGVLLIDRQWWGRAASRFSSRQAREESEALVFARAFLEKGQAPRAIRALTLIREGSPREAQALTIKGLALAALDEVGPARQTLERAWKLHPSADAARVLAAIYLSAYENERGLQMLIEASRLDPADFRPWYAMGESVYLRLRRYELAADAFRESLQRLPDHIESRIGLIDALIKFHHVEEAEPLLSGVLPERPNDPRVLALATEIMVEKGDYQAASQYVARALAVEPDHRDALILHARLLFRQRRRDEALTAVEHACALDPNDPSVLTLLSVIQSSLGLKERAAETIDQRRRVEKRSQVMETITQEILEKPRDPEPRYRLGRLAEEAGMKPLAIQTYLAALALAPDYEPARRGLLELGMPAAKLPSPSNSKLAHGLPRDGSLTTEQSRP